LIEGFHALSTFPHKEENSMKVPLLISTRNIDLTEEIEDLIREKADKLNTFHDGIISCRVMVEIPHRSQRKGVMYTLRIDMTVPGGEVVVKREPHNDLHVAVVNAFDVAERQLKGHAAKQRGEVKYHEEKPVGRIAKLFPDEGYGFLATLDGREIYFHENAVLGGKFNELQIGTMVSFIEQQGDKGPQASSVGIA
jgi:ribosomal subunit interface protein